MAEKSNQLAIPGIKGIKTRTMNLLHDFITISSNQEQRKIGHWIVENKF